MLNKVLQMKLRDELGEGFELSRDIGQRQKTRADDLAGHNAAEGTLSEAKGGAVQHHERRQYADE